MIDSTYGRIQVTAILKGSVHNIPYPTGEKKKRWSI
jgi:hypothetical protein